MANRFRSPRPSLAVALAVVLVFTSAVIAVAAEDGYKHSSSNCLSQRGTVAWMKDVPDDARILRDLSIPGTHDSGTFNYKGLVGHQCQCSTIKQQLEAGIRFLDFRLAFIDGNLRLTHGTLPTMGVSASFEGAMREVTEFLDAHPTEVIVARMQKEAAGSWFGRFDWKEEVLTEMINRYDRIIDRKCFSDDCTLGQSRGKIIFLSFGSEFWQYGFQLFAKTFTVKQDNSELTTIQAYSKYKDIRSTLIDASKSSGDSSFINFISAGKYATPDFYASGRSSPNGPSLWTGKSLTCLDNKGSRAYIDFPRKDCTCAKKASICSVHYKGMNAMLYEWIDNGLKGQAQSREVDYVFPKHLGILPMDFPNNALVNRIIDVNFAQEPASPANKQIEFVCGTKCSCIAGDATIETKNNGVVPARDVQAGDSIKGTDDATWCKVLKVAQVEKNGTVYGDFTKDHFVVLDDVVMPRGTNGSSRSMDLVNIATECAAARTTEGELFTPISEVFCTGNMSWSTYAVVYQALMRIVARTGAFWFDPSIYVQDPSGANSSAGMEDGVFTEQTWSAQLPPICSALNSCVSGGAECDEFERIAADWMRKHLPNETYLFVQTVYPSLGNPDAKKGNLLEDVRGARKNAFPIAAIVVIAVVGAAIVVAVAIAVWYRCFRKRNVAKSSPVPGKKATDSAEAAEEVGNVYADLSSTPATTHV